ncbi:hypothetical protein ACHAXS_014066 [Conticribra weissflogii]
MSDNEEKQLTGWDDDLLFDLAIDPFNKVASSEREAGRIAGRRAGFLEGLNIGRLKGWEIGLELGYVHGFATEVLNAYHRHPQASGMSTPSLSAKSESGNGHDSRVDENHEDFSEESTESGPVNRSSHRIERCLTLSRDIIKLVSDFPDPETLLLQNDKNETENEPSQSSVDFDDACEKQKAGEFCSHSPQSTENKTDNGGPGNFYESSGKRSRDNPLVDTTSMTDVSTSIQRIRAKFKLLCVLLRSKQQFDLRKVLESSNADPDLTTQPIGNGESSVVSGQALLNSGARDATPGDQINFFDSKRNKNNYEPNEQDW